MEAASEPSDKGACIHLGQLLRCMGLYDKLLPLPRLNHENSLLFNSSGIVKRGKSVSLFFSHGMIMILGEQK